MITAQLQTILTNCGCTLVLYESDKLANLITDLSNQNDIIGLVVQLNDITLEVKGNAIQEHYNPLYIEVMKQVRLEDTAATNELVLQALLDICKCIIKELILLAEFKTIQSVPCVKITETKYDANVLGWSIKLDLTYLNNEPCIITSP